MDGHIPQEGVEKNFTGDFTTYSDCIRCAVWRYDSFKWSSDAGSEESHTATQRGAKVKTTYHYTLHCIGFYYRNRAELGTEGSELPDQAMGFFSTEIRDRAYQMIQKAFEQ